MSAETFSTSFSTGSVEAESGVGQGDALSGNSSFEVTHADTERFSDTRKYLGLGALRQTVEFAGADMVSHDDNDEVRKLDEEPMQDNVLHIVHHHVGVSGENGSGATSSSDSADASAAMVLSLVLPIPTPVPVVA